jgi:hypothetical protein
MATRAERLTEREQKLRQKLAEIQAQKTKLSETERKRDTRRKILIGAAVLKAVDQGNVPEEELRQILETFVTVARDREFLGLPPKAPAEDTEGEAPEAPADGFLEV